MPLPTVEFQKFLEAGLFPGENQLAGQSVYVESVYNDTNALWSLFLRLFGCDIANSHSSADFILTKKSHRQMLRLLGASDAEDIIVYLLANGFPGMVVFSQRGKHRLTAPAVLKFHSNGRVQVEEFWINGQKHRLDGPAVTCCNPNGLQLYEEFWVYGDKLDTIEFAQIKRRAEALAAITTDPSAVCV